VLSAKSDISFHIERRVHVQRNTSRVAVFVFHRERAGFWRRLMGRGLRKWKETKRAAVEKFCRRQVACTAKANLSLALSAKRQWRTGTFLTT
jgi:site-specific recombinase XerC